MIIEPAGRPPTGARSAARRAVLLGGLGGLGAVLAGCSSGTHPPRAGAPAPAPRPDVTSAERELAALEARFGGRLGVLAVDTGTGVTVGHRAAERFLMASTVKVLSASAVLALRTRRPGLLDRVVRYEPAQLVEYSPVTSQHVATGMTVSALCQASVTRSDNTAANLLTGLVGGPAAVTAFVRTLGDRVTRADRTEPDLNTTTPGDERDTSTPAQMVGDLHALALGDGLDPAGRDLLVGWLVGNTTGGEQIRAGLPPGWRVGDKTGSGAQGEINDVAVVWPPGRAPWVVAVYTAPRVPNAVVGRATVADAARIVAQALTS